MLDTIKGELKLFTKEVEAKDKKGKKTKRVLYSACIGGTKQEDDSYLNVYVPVNFSKEFAKKVEKAFEDEDELRENFDVIITEAWFRAYKDKDDNVKPALFINSAKIVK